MSMAKPTPQQVARDRAVFNALMKDWVDVDPDDPIDHATWMHGAASALLELRAYEAKQAEATSPDKIQHPVCGQPGCNEPIRWIPSAGFGQRGHWMHTSGGQSDHEAWPKVYVT